MEQVLNLWNYNISTHDSYLIKVSICIKSSFYGPPSRLHKISLSCLNKFLHMFLILASNDSSKSFSSGFFWTVIILCNILILLFLLYFDGVFICLSGFLYLINISQDIRYLLDICIVLSLL